MILMARNLPRMNNSMETIASKMKIHVLFTLISVMTRNILGAIALTMPPLLSLQSRDPRQSNNFYHLLEQLAITEMHILAPLTKVSGLKGKLPWSDEYDKAFKQMKALLAELEALLQYPVHNKTLS